MREAVILAAGSGIRLGGGAPKGLIQMAGRPLLGWITSALADAGLQIVHLIVSAKDAQFEQAADDLSGKLEVRLSVCPDWHLGNGRSAAHAQCLVSDSRFLLLMSDHLVSAEHVRRVAACPGDSCALGTSGLAPWIDPEDATKVAVDASGLIREIGKDLPSYDAIDTGVFAFTHAIFPALEEGRRAAEYSLTAGNRRLCRAGLLRSVSVGDLRWHDIDTPADLAVAEQWLRQRAGG